MLIGSGKDYVLNSEEIAAIGYPAETCKIYAEKLFTNVLGTQQVPTNAVKKQMTRLLN